MVVRPAIPLWARRSKELPQEMISRPEQLASRSLRSVLADLQEGDLVPDSSSFREFLLALTRFLPQVLAEIHEEWKGRGIDDVFSALANKIGPECIEVLGLYCQLSDMQFRPLHCRIQLAPSVDEISWIECRMGDNNHDPFPYRSENALQRKLRLLPKQVGGIAWMYEITYGARR